MEGKKTAQPTRSAESAESAARAARPSWHVNPLKSPLGCGERHMNLNFRGTRDVLAAEQDRGLQSVGSCPRVVSLAERMFKSLEDPIQVLPQIVISGDGIPGRQRLVIQVIVIDRLPSVMEIDFFNLRGGRASK